MKKNLNSKIAAIVAVLVIFIYGIFGVPSGVSGKALLESMTRRIHLGLDLRGGAHLILEVVVSEAVSAETDNTIARIQQDFKGANLTFSQVYKPDPKKPEAIRIEGTNPTQSGAIRTRNWQPCYRLLPVRHSRLPVPGPRLTHSFFA